MLAGLITFLVYHATLAPDLAWDYHGADGAELITAAVTLGVPHPPGYPTYVLVGRLLGALPLGTVAYRFNLFSALCMAGAAGLASATAYYVLRRMTSGPHSPPRATATPVMAATTAGLTLAFLPLIWQQALITEVYGLNMLLLSALLFQLLRQNKEHNGWVAGLLLGLAMTTHLTSMFMAPLALLRTTRARWPHLFLGAAAGAAPYLLLPLLALSHSPVVWADPGTLQGWWWLVSAQLYRPNVLAPDQIAWLERLVHWVSEMSVWFFALATLLVLRGRRQLLAPARPTALVMIGTGLLYGLYALTYDANNALVYLLPGLLLVSILVARVYGQLGPVALLLPLALLMLNFNRLDLSEQRQARRLATPLVQEAPQEALLLTDGDRATFTLWYLQHVEGARPDLVVVDRNLLAFDWYRRRLQRQYPELKQLDADDLALFRQANGKERWLCSARITDAPAPDVYLDCSEA